jgi:hypothetical protein
MDVGHMDTVRGTDYAVEGIDLEFRRLSMVYDVKRGVRAAPGPVIVQMGAMHLPYVMQALAGQLDVVPLTFFDDESASDPISDAKRSCSFQLAHEDILRLRAGPTIEDRPIDPSALFLQMGVDIQAPLAAPLQMKSPWERQADE